ncbi:MAG: hypothetical protein Q7K42_01020, partial [Candidatus Diapherotrites archaeon]|nr:hypothetical protein [Candidatus Diapherotrites archaeon]
MKKNLLAFFAILFFAQVNAIAIIAPTVYVISVSILGLIANLVISAIAFIAIQGFASKTFAGKSLYKIIKFFYTILGKVSIYAISLSIGIFISAPFDMNTSINSGIIAAGISFAVLALFHSRELVLDGKKLKHFKAIALFSIFVLVAGSATSFFSLKVEEIQTEKSFFEIVGKNLWSAQSIAQETNQISAPQSMEESSDYRTLQKTSEPQPE